MAFVGFHYVSNAISKRLNFPVYSIDRLFFEGLLANSCPAAKHINDIINGKFTSIASESDLLSAADEDEMDNLEKKINLILSGKEKKAPSKKQKGSSTRSNASKKSSTSGKTSSKGSKKKGKGKREPDVFMDLSLDLVADVLKEKLKEFRIGVVIESLNSIILRVPSVALHILLNSIGYARYIHFILFSFTYSDHCAYKEYLKKIKETERLEEIKKVIENVNDMGADEFANLPTEIQEIYKEKVLKERKLASQTKKENYEKYLYCSIIYF